MVQWPQGPCSPAPVSLQARQLRANNDDPLSLLDEYLMHRVLPSEVSIDDRVIVKRSAGHFVIHQDRLFRRLAHVVVSIVWIDDRVALLN